MNRLSNPGLLVACLLGILLPSTLGQGISAAGAVEVIRKEKGAELLSRLVEMRGEMGEPLPRGWKFVFNEPGARGGIREIVVQDGQILSERTPIRGFGGTGDLPIVEPSKVNLDTNQLFRVVNQAAVRQGLGFHWLDYTLRHDVQNAQAVWIVQLTDYLGANVGDIKLAADSLGTVQKLRVQPRDFIQQATVAPRPTPRPRGGMVGRVENFGRNVGETVKRSTLNAIGSVEEWLFGERTIGREDEP